MIDNIIIKGCLGIPKPHQEKCLSLVTYERLYEMMTKRTTTYINSPITRAQIEVKYQVKSSKSSNGISIAYLELKIPLASATMGHNYAHAGLSSIRNEMKCAALLTRCILTVLGFTTTEINHFMKTTEVQLLELTWHTPTESKSEQNSLQLRTKNYFNGQQSVSSRHDIDVSDVDFRETNGKTCLLVTLKSGDKLRQYAKADHISARRRSDRKQSHIEKEVRPYIKPILDVIGFHVRNEVILCGNTLKRMGLEHPNSWYEGKLTNAIDSVWSMIGLGLAQSTTETPSTKTLSPEATVTFENYLAGEDLQALPAYTFTRHRQSIIQIKGVDIANTRKVGTDQLESLSQQLSYKQRWEPSGDIQKFILCEETAPDMIKELRRGLDFLRDGVIPDLDGEGEDARNEWLVRWRAFADREGGGKKYLERKENIRKLLLSAA
jgi:hypothetical protein